MYTVTRRIEFCYGHRLLDYSGKCRYLHGHNGVAVVTAAAEELDSRGMVIDFADLKKDISGWIDEHLDHRMLLRQDDPILPLLREFGEPVFAMDTNPTAENIARLIHDQAVTLGYPVVRVQLWETPQCFATYETDPI